MPSPRRLILALPALLLGLLPGPAEARGGRRVRVGGRRGFFNTFRLRQRPTRW